MAFSLTDNTNGAIPITALTKDRFASWAAAAPEGERNWAQSTGFAADTGKLVLVPGENGRLGRVLVGLGEGPEARRRCGRSPGCRRRCRKGATGSTRCPRAPTRPGWRWAGRSPPTPLPATTPSPRAVRRWSGPRAPIAAKPSASLARCSSPATSPTPRPATSAPRSWRRRRSASPRRPAPAIASSSATICWPRIIRPSTPSAAPARVRHAWSTSSGAIRRRPR